VIPPSAGLVDRLLAEDVPYLDLTSTLLGLPTTPARMAFSARGSVVVAGTTLVSALCERVGARVELSLPSGSRVEPGQPILIATGTASQLHLAWKVSANVYEAACGIATRTRALIDAARQANPEVEVFATRKMIPGTKELAIEAILAGGALPHRLGLSETVLVFAQHTAFLGGVDGLIERLPTLRRRALEKVVLVEVDNAADALRLAHAGVGGIQFDKVSPAELAEAVAGVRAVAPGVVLVAAGGVTPGNAAEYAATGVDALASSWMYAGAPADIAVRIGPDLA
jgi:molybdenum transport protein